MKITVKAPAKINLALDVLHKRNDGYHEVKMVMTTIDLADHLRITLLESDRIQIESTSGIIPNDKRNLAYKAAALLKERFAIKQGCKIEISKKIPVAAGLAGGSSDCAAALRGLNELWQLGLSPDELATIGAEIGSDVAFCVYGGTAVATGRGEIVKPISSPAPAWVILAKPSIGVSTADIYEQIDVSTCFHPNVEAMIQAIETQNYKDMCHQLGNSLEDVTLKLYPKVAKIKEKMKQLGADGVLMSGSGPTVFGLTQYDTKMRRIVNGLRGFCKNVYAVRLLGKNIVE